MNPTKEEAQRGKSTPWIIAITLLSAMFVSYYQWNRHTTQTRVYTEVMKDYNPPINKGTLETSTSSDVIDQAIKEFDLRNFDASYDLFKSVKPKSDNIYWYLGHIALIKGKVYEAKNHSKKISDQQLQSELLLYVDRVI